MKIAQTPYEIMRANYTHEHIKILAQELINLSNETVMPQTYLLVEFSKRLNENGYSKIRCLTFAQQAINQYALEQLARK